MLSNSINKIVLWTQKNGYATYDHYDFLSSKWGQFSKQFFKKNKLFGIPLVAPIIIADIYFPNIRKIFAKKRLSAEAMPYFVSGYFRLYEIEGKQKKGKGPIVTCIDSSGSMDGTPEIWAKAVALTLLEIAKEQKRDFFCIHFSSGYRGNNLHTNSFPKDAPFEIEQLIDMAEYFEAGGTEIEPPLDLSREKIGTETNYEKADIIFN